MTPAMRTEICSPKCEGRQSAFTFFGTISRPENGPFFGGALLLPYCKHVHVHRTIMHLASVTSLWHLRRFGPVAFVLVKTGTGCDVCLRHIPQLLPFLVSVHGTAYAMCSEPTAAGAGCGHLSAALHLNVSSCLRNALCLSPRMVLHELVFACSWRCCSSYHHCAPCAYERRVSAVVEGVASIVCSQFRAPSGRFSSGAERQRTGAMGRTNLVGKLCSRSVSCHAGRCCRALLCATCAWHCHTSCFWWPVHEACVGALLGAVGNIARGARGAALRASFAGRGAKNDHRTADEHLLRKLSWPTVGLHHLDNHFYASIWNVFGGRPAVPVMQTRACSCHSHACCIRHESVPWHYVFSTCFCACEGGHCLRRPFACPRGASFSGAPACHGICIALRAYRCRHGLWTPLPSIALECVFMCARCCVAL